MKTQLGIPLVGLLLAPSILAQQFTLPKSVVAGGGGLSSGQVYAVHGTIGQPDAGKMSGGAFTLTGGFWSLVVAVPTPGAPALEITRQSEGILISWPVGATSFVLEETSALHAPTPTWTPSALPCQTNATTMTVTIPAPHGLRFYRLTRR